MQRAKRDQGYGIAITPRAGDPSLAFSADGRWDTEWEVHEAPFLVSEYGRFRYLFIGVADWTPTWNRYRGKDFWGEQDVVDSRSAQSEL